jgi:hypothetical protein
MNIVKIRTNNVPWLKETLAQLPGGVHTVLPETEVNGVVTVETTNPGFLKFAVTNQGYGEVVES